MLVVTEVFIAPPTRGERERERGERGCVAQGEGEKRERKTEDRCIEKKGERKRDRLEEQQEGGIIEGINRRSC